MARTLNPGFLFVSLCPEPINPTHPVVHLETRNSPRCPSGLQEKQGDRNIVVSLSQGVWSHPPVSETTGAQSGRVLLNTLPQERTGVLTGALRPRWSGGSTSTGHSPMVQQGEGCQGHSSTPTNTSLTYICTSVSTGMSKLMVQVTHTNISHNAGIS